MTPFTIDQLREMERADGPELLASLAEAALAWYGEETDETRYRLHIATGIYWRAYARREADSARESQ